MAPHTKSGAGNPIYPVALLRGSVSELESSVAATLVKPKREAVHRLRITTRRIEAQIALLTELGWQDPALRQVERAGKRLNKLLTRLRRAAGRVRDLDVQRRLAKEAVEDGATRRVRSETRKLRQILKDKRHGEAERLVATLQADGLKLERRLEKLIEVLDPLAQNGVSRRVLHKLVLRSFEQRRVRATGEAQEVERMHGVRKAAKLARYMSEGAQGGGSQAAQFESLQKTGGRWHDWWMMHDTARRETGRRSGLAQVLCERERSARDEFLKMLEV